MEKSSKAQIFTKVSADAWNTTYIDCRNPDNRIIMDKVARGSESYWHIVHTTSCKIDRDIKATSLKEAKDTIKAWIKEFKNL